MGLTYAELTLTNLFTNQQMQVNALVDTGATFMCVTEEIALQLGFDITEVRQQTVTLADGHQRKVPKIAPIEIAFANRNYVTEAVVLGNEPLLGILPLEAMDLVVDPRQQALIVNPQHPNYSVALAKERSKNNLRKFIPGLGKRWDSIDQLSQIVIETFLRADDGA